MKKKNDLALVDHRGKNISLENEQNKQTRTDKKKISSHYSLISALPFPVPFLKFFIDQQICIKLPLHTWRGKALRGSRYRITNLIATKAAQMTTTCLLSILHSFWVFRSNSSVVFLMKSANRTPTNMPTGISISLF